MRYPRSPQVAWVSKFTLQSSPFLKKEGSCRCLPLCLCFCVCVCVCVCQSVCAGVLVDEYPVTTGHFCVMNLAELDSSFPDEHECPETVSNPLPSKQFRVPPLCLQMGCEKCGV